ncbi:MAG: TIM barrel protein [Actinomycetota bacterium]|nr:TIM barrel protein [Actinomycetota bacterium]
MSKEPGPVRCAGAPISWGVSEVTDWGHQLPVDRVLREMAALGLVATEFGPDGFLPAEPQARAAYLARYGLRAVGGFLPTVLHEPATDPMAQLDAFVTGCLAADADVVVLAAHTGREGYDSRPPLDDLGWKTLLGNLDRLSARCRDRGVVAALHPHVGTMIETCGDVQRVLAGSDIGLCVDTGHLLVGGTDPVLLTHDYPDRVVHVHLKDVDGVLAQQVRAGSLTFAEGVRAGLFVPLGTGTVDVTEMISTLRAHAYAGWYVLEQDVMLDGPEAGDRAAGDVRASLDHLRRALA